MGCPLSIVFVQKQLLNHFHYSRAVNCMKTPARLLIYGSFKLLSIQESGAHGRLLIPNLLSISLCHFFRGKLNCQIESRIN